MVMNIQTRHNICRKHRRTILPINLHPQPPPKKRAVNCSKVVFVSVYLREIMINHSPPPPPKSHLPQLPHLPPLIPPNNPMSPKHKPPFPPRAPRPSHPLLPLNTRAHPHQRLPI